MGVSVEFKSHQKNCQIHKYAESNIEHFCNYFKFISNSIFYFENKAKAANILFRFVKALLTFLIRVLESTENTK